MVKGGNRWAKDKVGHGQTTRTEAGARQVLIRVMGGQVCLVVLVFGLPCNRGPVVAAVGEGKDGRRRRIEVLSEEAEDGAARGGETRGFAHCTGDREQPPPGGRERCDRGVFASGVFVQVDGLLTSGTWSRVGIAGRGSQVGRGYCRGRPFPGGQVLGDCYVAVAPGCVLG